MTKFRLVGLFAGCCVARLALPAAWAQDTAGGIEEQVGRRELFVNDALLKQLDGATLTMHRPEARDVAIVCDSSWEISPAGEVK